MASSGAKRRSKRSSCGRRARALVRCLPLSSALIVHPALAAKWDIIPTLGIEETYTDNLRLTPTNKQSDFATVLTPGVIINGVGARGRLDLTYSLQSIYHTQEGAQNELNHLLNASATAEMVEKLAYVDARASIQQLNTSVLGPQAVSNVNITGNRTTAKTFLVSPYLRRTFGSEAEGLARYTYSVVDSDSGNFRQTEGNRVDLSLASGPSYRLYTWNITAYTDQIKGRTTADTEFSAINATGRRLISYNLYLTSSVGYEKNNYVSIGGAPTSGVSWSTGIDWMPTPRTRLAGTIGQRYYGDSYSFDFNHRARITVWSARYSEEITTTREQLLLPTSFSTAGYLDSLFVTRFPDPIERQRVVQQFISDNGLPSNLVTPTEVFTQQVYLVKRWQASAGLQGVRHTILANFYAQTQDAQSVSASVSSGDFRSSTNIRQAGAGLTWNWRVSQHDAANAAIGYTKYETPGLQRDDTLTYLRLLYSHQFYPKMFGSLAFRRLHNDSNQPGFNYTENAITALLQMRF
jgi:uncharacterized protein (PEP-CTERM system associated)